MQLPSSPSGWSAPLFIDIKSAGVGISAGISKSENILILDTEHAVQSFLHTQVCSLITYFMIQLIVSVFASLPGVIELLVQIHLHLRDLEDYHIIQIQWQRSYQEQLNFSLTMCALQNSSIAQVSLDSEVSIASGPAGRRMHSSELNMSHPGDTFSGAMYSVAHGAMVDVSFQGQQTACPFPPYAASHICSK